jgi:hypothetical protein
MAFKMPHFPVNNLATSPIIFAIKTNSSTIVVSHKTSPEKSTLIHVTKANGEIQTQTHPANEKKVPLVQCTVYDIEDRLPPSRAASLSRRFEALPQ